MRKNDKSIAGDDLNLGAPTKTGGSVPLKDQLKKKTLEINDYRGKLGSDSSFRNLTNSNNSGNGNEDSSNKDKEIVGKAKSKPLSDSDWTQLLSAPNQATTSASNRGNGLPGVRGLRKDGRRQGSAGSASNLSVLEVKKNQKIGSNNVVKSVQRAGGVGEGRKLNGKVSDGKESGFLDSTRRSSTGELKSDGKVMGRGELDYRDVGVETLVEKKDKGNEENGAPFDSRELSLEGPLLSVKKNDGLSNKKIGGENVGDHLRSSTTVRGKHESSEASRSSTSEDLKRGFTSVTDGSSESDSDSGSSSDSESEREKEERRKQREKILAEKAAAKAVEAIKERENTVARLEGEKQSLEKILEVQVKQQAQEVLVLINRFLISSFFMSNKLWELLSVCLKLCASA